jgi:hypothetical protein
MTTRRWLILVGLAAALSAAFEMARIAGRDEYEKEEDHLYFKNGSSEDYYTEGSPLRHPRRPWWLFRL